MLLLSEGRIVTVHRRRLLLGLLLALVLALLTAWLLRWQLSALWHWRDAQLGIAQRDFLRARTQLRQCLTVWSDDPTTLLLAASVARRDGDFSDAERYLSRASKGNAVPEAIVLERKLLNLQKGDLEEIDGMFAFCREHPDDANAPILLESAIVGALRALDLRRASALIALWNQQRTQPVEQMQGLLWQGDLAIRTGNYENAIVDFREALKSQPTSQLARRKLAEILVRYSPAEALEHLSVLRRNSAQDRRLRLLSARAHRTLSEFDEAKKLLDALLAESAEDVEILVERGQLALELARGEEAERLLRKAHRLDPLKRDTNAALARCLNQLGKEEEAKVFQERVTDIDAAFEKRLQQILQTKKDKP